MNIFLISFSRCDDNITGNRLQNVRNSGAHPNLDHVWADYVDQECRGISDWPYGSPEEHNINRVMLPVVIFMGRTSIDGAEGVYTEVARLQGTSVTESAIANKIRSFEDATAPDTPGGGGVIPTENEEGNGFGFGFGFKLPAWMWWLAAGVAGYKATGAKNKSQQVVFGALTGLAANNALKAGKSSSAMGRLPLPSGVGKVVDAPRSKPGSRADQYHGGLTDPSQVNAMISKFKLHSMEWGNWVPTAQREEKFWEMRDALSKLAKSMNIPQSKIGFGGRLSLSYGSRGRGGRALATYNPGIHHINLTKDNGDGSLAHEYGHAIDYHASRKQGFPPSGGRSQSFQIVENRKGGDIPQLFEKVYEALYYNADGSMTSFAKKIKKLPDYWKQRNEVWARTFEAWVHLQLRNKGIKSTMLTASRYDSTVYPSTELLKKADPYIRKIITKVIGR